jgi:hypothetical protein
LHEFSVRESRSRVFRRPHRTLAFFSEEYGCAFGAAASSGDFSFQRFDRQYAPLEW